MFKSEINAKKLLKTIGYYKLINAYRTPFIYDNDGTRKFIDGVYFEDLYNIYLFDRKLRTIVFEAVTNVEINFKAYLSKEGIIIPKECYIKLWLERYQI